MAVLLPNDPAFRHHRAPGADGLEIHYVRQGSGRPVLLLHGWPGFWYDWRHVVVPLSESADVIAPDLRGYGESDAPNGEPVDVHGPGPCARDLAALLEHLDLSDVLIAGHDIGASIAQTLTKTIPDRIAGLVLFNPPYPGIGARRFDPKVQPEFWYQHFHNLQWSQDLIGLNRVTTRLYLKHFYDHWVGCKERIAAKEFEAIVDVYARPGAFEASIAYYRARAGSRVKDSGASAEDNVIDVLTTVTWGELDPVMQCEWRDRIPEFFTTVTDVPVLDGVGHFVPFEAPEAVIDAILNHPAFGTTAA